MLTNLTLLLIAWLPAWHPQSGADWETCGHWLLWADIRWEGPAVRVVWETGQVETIFYRIGPQTRGVVALLEPGTARTVRYDAEVLGEGEICWLNGPDGCHDPPATGTGYIEITEEGWRHNHKHLANGRPCPGLDISIFADGFETGNTDFWSRMRP